MLAVFSPRYAYLSCDVTNAIFNKRHSLHTNTPFYDCHQYRHYYGYTFRVVFGVLAPEPGLISRNINQSSSATRGASHDIVWSVSSK